ncbi:SufS family cysteine desulfurase [Candidatus Micrarchaeota archaeon]|nr:SufS family cysteine desulfurase [Candidatus Micrarchaeota archaeon]
MDVDKIRKDFPILDNIVYLDSAATSQRPASVIESINKFYKDQNSNVARGLYQLAEEATFEYEQVRKKTSKFISSNENEVIFTKNTTEAINLVMRGYGEKFIKKEDKIVVTMLEHHSNFVPWQELAKRTGAKFEVVGLTPEGNLDEADLVQKLKGANLFAFSAASNVLGTMPDLKRLCKLAKDAGAISLVDAAQYAPSHKISVKEFGCDFLTFSGHKMLSPFGVGVLYGKEELLESMDPFLYGSEMIRTVTSQKSDWNTSPHKFESGTPNVAAVIGLGVALDYLNNLEMENITSYTQSLSAYMYSRLNELDFIHVLGPEKRTGLVSFTIDKVHPHDIAAILNEDKVCVRSGHHCAMPLHEYLGIPASTRASIYFYNKKSEIDQLIVSLEKVKKLFG